MLEFSHVVRRLLLFLIAGVAGCAELQIHRVRWSDSGACYVERLENGECVCYACHRKVCEKQCREL